ncbi:MAG: methionine--tRNA ligase [Vicinamibacterales bacterium]
MTGRHMSKFYITTAIDYVNSRPHLGTAYEKITADIIARYKRLAGVPTHFLMGNDEHSLNVFRRAKEQGLEAKAYCDQMEREFREVWQRLDVSFDDFIRTTDERHRIGVTALVERIRTAGDIYEGHYEGWYCNSCEAFKQEKDLVDDQCPVHRTKPDWITEKNYFFRLSKYQQALLDHYARHPEALEPEVRRNEILSLIQGGLDDISISRAGQAWGIPLPFDPQSVVYVWFDALINYVSALGFGGDDAEFARWWPASLHVIGKDITRFHCVIWPAMLMSAGLELPERVFGHGFVYFKGEKMSKSLGTIVDPLDAASKFGPDPLRLFLVREFAYGQDGDFSWERFEERFNSDLANNLGNLVSRIATMADKYCGGRLPRPAGEPGRLSQVAAAAVAAYRESMDRFALQDGMAAAYGIIDAANSFIAETEPWKLAKEEANAPRVAQILYEVAEALRIAAVLLLPAMPASAAEILRRVGTPTSDTGHRLDDTSWGAAGDLMTIKADAMWPRIGEARKT